MRAQAKRLQKSLPTRIHQTRARALLENMPKTEEVAGGSNESELAMLIKLLTVKMSKEEVEKEKLSISPDCFGKIIPDFDGNSVSVNIWFDNFEKNADAYELSEKQRYVQARNKMVGSAKLFLDAVTVTNYEMLKVVLIEKFQRTFSSAEVHKKLTTRKKTDSESFHEYTLIMRKIAAAGKIEEESVIRYIVDGLRVKPDLKYNMYNAKTYKELREQYEIYDRIKASEYVI